VKKRNLPTLKVKELIEMLKLSDPDAEIVYYEGGEECPITWCGDSFGDDDDGRGPQSQVILYSNP
jgi:hypothetical protein